MDARAAPPKNKRWGEPAKFLPVAFVCFTISGLYLIYLFFHCIPMMQSDVAPMHRDDARRSRGIWQTTCLNIFTFMLVICYIRSILEHPGEIPDDDPDWRYAPGDGAHQTPQLDLKETKKSGDRRHCKWCGKYKPDRCHHCRVCRTCILKMDHHCPWIYNCVGFKNYKYFFLLLFYCVITLHLITWTMLESVLRSWDTTTPFVTMFFVLWGETLAIFMGSLLTIFWGFHIWLMFQARTTIEFCEKAMPKESKKEQDPDKANAASVYDMGCFANLKQVLGPNPLAWPLPIAPPIGDGLTYVTAETRLMGSWEANRGVRRKKKLFR